MQNMPEASQISMDEVQATPDPQQQLQDTLQQQLLFITKKQIELDTGLIDLFSRLQALFNSLENYEPVVQSTLSLSTTVYKFPNLHGRRHSRIFVTSPVSITVRSPIGDSSSITLNTGWNVLDFPEGFGMQAVGSPFVCWYQAFNMSPGEAI